MNIAIVGAGATGLTLAYRLCKEHKVTLFESDENHGGLVSTIKIGNSRIEKFYHHIFTSDTELVNMIDELGLTSKLMWLDSKSGIYLNNKLYPFSSPFDLLNFKELPFFDRLSMGLLVYKAKYVKDWKSLENVSAKEWVIKNAGKNVYDKVWGPLLASKFDIDSENVSAVWIWNKFKLRGSTRSKNVSKEMLGYMNGSFGIIFDEMATRIKASGSEIRYSSRINGINPNNDNTLKIKWDNGEENFDRVIVTSAPETLKQMNIPFEQSYFEKVDKIKYKSNICMILELKEPVSPYYWITVAQNDFPFVLMVEHTNLISSSEYKSNIVYLSRYLDRANELFSYSDDKIGIVFIDYLSRMFPDWKKSSIINTHVFRSIYAQPTVFKNYSELILPYKTPIDNLFVANMSSIYPEDRGQNYAVRLGNEIAELLNRTI